MPGRRFNLPDGYALATLPGRRFRFTRGGEAPYASPEEEAYNSPDDAARAAWEHADQRVPDRISGRAR